MKDSGVSLIEVVVVTAVVGALAAVLAFDYEDWGSRNAVEKITKELYTDIMRAKVLAVAHGREHYVILGERSYSVVEDTNENGDYDAGDAALSDFPKHIAYPIDWNNRHPVSKVAFDKRGLVTELRTIWVALKDADFNCIKVSKTRVIMGRYVDDVCVAESKKSN